MYSSPELRVNVLQRRANLCYRLSNGAVPISVMQQLAVLAMNYENEAVRWQNAGPRNDATPKHPA